VAYEAGLEDHTEPANDLAASRIEQLLDRLMAAAGAPPDAAGPAAAPEPSADADYELPAVRLEQETHLRAFVGREPDLHAVADWIDRQAEGGYLLWLGPPGQGKSALMAELARREGARGGCLLHMIKSHRDPRRFVPALISQAAKLARARFGDDAYRGDLQDLRNSLVRAVRAVVERTGRAVLVLDALDEVAAGDEQGAYEPRLEFLPPALPEGVRVVLTCRPDLPLVQGLRARLSGLQERAVPPLTEADFRLVLGRRLEPGALRALEAAVDLTTVFARLGGNPLFLHAAAARLAAEMARAAAEGRSPRIEAAELPDSYAAFFRDIYHRIAEKAGTRWTSPEGRQKARLLHLLCVAREPLGYEDLAGLMAAGGGPLAVEDCRDRLDEMSQYLLDSGGSRFKPWHQGLVDYVRADVLGGAGVRQVEEAFCTWLQAAGPRHYGIQHRPGHLLAAGKLEGAVALLTDLAFLEAKAEAGMVYDLVADFGSALAALPDGHGRRPILRLLEEALRTDVHFIDRHPTALFQCLWNLGWWYDCPAAAKHYYAPAGGWPPEGPPWQRPGPKLSTLLEAWRADKAKAAPGFRWVRSLRPPDVHLGTALVAVFRGHQGGVSSVAYSPDGSRIASASWDGTARIWDARLGAEVLCLRGHQKEVWGVAFAPDSGRVASGSEDGTVRVWETAGGRELACFCPGAPVYGVVFSPDGRHLAGGSGDHTARLWDAVNGQPRACLRGHGAAVTSVAFTPDGRCLVSGSADGSVRLWDAQGERPLAYLRGHEQEVMSVAVARDGRRILSGSLDRTARLWDVPGCRESACFRGHGAGVTCVAFSADDRRIVTATDRNDAALRIWDVPSGSQWAKFSGHEGAVNGVALSPDGRRIASGSYDGTVRLWSAEGGDALLSRPTHNARITCLTFAPDGTRLVSGSSDGTARVWDVSEGTSLLCLRGHGKAVTQVAFAPEGRRFLSRSDGETV
jgi:WD40 repeat protein